MRERERDRQIELKRHLHCSSASIVGNLEMFLSRIRANEDADMALISGLFYVREREILEILSV